MMTDKDKEELAVLSAQLDILLAMMRQDVATCHKHAALADPFAAIRPSRLNVAMAANEAGGDLTRMCARAMDVDSAVWMVIYSGKIAALCGGEGNPHIVGVDLDAIRASNAAPASEDGKHPRRAEVRAASAHADCVMETARVEARKRMHEMFPWVVWDLDMTKRATRYGSALRGVCRAPFGRAMKIKNETLRRSWQACVDWLKPLANSFSRMAREYALAEKNLIIKE